MAEFTAADVKRLRDATGAGMMDCKKALTEADGDFDKAVEFLRVKGAKDVGKRLERSTTNGIVVSKDGALLELDCETDFVAKNADFGKLAERLLDIALQTRPADAQALLATEVEGQTVAALVEGESARIGFRDGVVPRLAALQGIFREQQVEVEVKRAMPLSIVLRARGAYPILETLGSAFHVLEQGRTRPTPSARLA